MSSLKLYLLGPPRVELDNSVVDIRRRKALALLAYLAVAGEDQRRDTLATLLWPDASQNRARASLSRDLSSLNKRLAGSWLTADRETVALRDDLQLWVDCVQFQQRLASCQSHNHPAEQICPACLEALTEAVSLCRADFLSGFTLSGCPDFDEWQSFQTESLRRELATALERLIRAHQAQSDPATALPYARRWLSLDPLHEPAHRQLMQLYAQTGDRGAAVHQYQECIQVIEAELGVSPAEETTALYERIRTEAVRPVEPVSPVPRHNLPPPPTPFVGRVEELARIANRLADPACRLLTLTGPGGIGKTRLALQAGGDLVETSSDSPQFSHGLYFVSLAAVSSTDSLVAAIAEGLSFSFYSEVLPRQQLLDYLREKELLLMLDNFEHLLPPPLSPPAGGTEGASPERGMKGRASAAGEKHGATELVTDILSAAPAVKIMATSREALNLQEEWLYAVDGLTFPKPPPSPPPETVSVREGVESYSAVQLFEQCARRANPDFSPATAEECVVRICQLVEGMPLGIELAAAWLKMFPCENIIQELERGLDFLTTSLRNVPVRHRSMRAVFEHSWQLLSEEEQRVFRQLSVFRGGFAQDAAEQVARATFAELVALVEKSLLRPTPAERYHLHELLRQFAAEKLQAVPEEEEAAQDRHSAYYLDFLQQREAALKGKQQKATLIEINEEIENVRLAWLWAVERDEIDGLDQALGSLYEFYHIRGRFQEGKEIFEKTAAQLQVRISQFATKYPQGESAQYQALKSVLGRTLARQGAFRDSLGLDEAAKESLQQSLTIARQLDLQAEVAFIGDFLATFFIAQGEYVKGKQMYQACLDIYRECGNQAGMAWSGVGLGYAALSQGEFLEAERHFQESLVLYREAEYPAGIAFSLDKLGFITFMLGEYALSGQYYQESVAVAREIGDQLGIAKAASGLGLVAWARGGPHLARAKPLLEEGLAICGEIGHRLHLAGRLDFLGQVANSLGEYQRAQEYGEESLAILTETDNQWGKASTLSTLGEAACGLGNSLVARRHLCEALNIATSAQQFPVVLQALGNWAAFLAKKGDVAGADVPTGETVASRAERIEQAVELIALIRDHPACWQVYKDKASRLLAELETELPAEVVSAALERGKARKLADVVAEILAEG